MESDNDSLLGLLPAEIQALIFASVSLADISSYVRSYLNNNMVASYYE